MSDNLRLSKHACIVFVYRRTPSAIVGFLKKKKKKILYLDIMSMATISFHRVGININKPKKYLWRFLINSFTFRCHHGLKWLKRWNKVRYLFVLQVLLLQRNGENAVSERSHTDSSLLLWANRLKCRDRTQVKYRFSQLLSHHFVDSDDPLLYQAESQILLLMPTIL